MALKQVLTKIIYGTAAELASANPVLLKGQFANATDTGVVKVGDGTTAYSSITALGGASAPFTDATAIIKNDSDATKLIKISAASVTTGTTRTLTAQNKSYTIADNADFASYAPLASPTLTGTPAAPTASVNTNTTQLATTAFVVAQKTVLGSTYYDPNSVATYTTTSTTFAAVDTTNLRVTFTAPPSGNVIVKFGGWLNGTQPDMGVLEGSTVRAVSLMASINSYGNASKKITGLTAGTSYTYDLAFASTTGGLTTTFKAGGGLSSAGYGACYIEIISA